MNVLLYDVSDLNYFISIDNIIYKCQYNETTDIRKYIKLNSREIKIIKSYDEYVFTLLTGMLEIDSIKRFNLKEILNFIPSNTVTYFHVSNIDIINEDIVDKYIKFTVSYISDNEYELIYLKEIIDNFSSFSVTLKKVSETQFLGIIKGVEKILQKLNSILLYSYDVLINIIITMYQVINSIDEKDYSFYISSFLVYYSSLLTQKRDFDPIKINNIKMFNKFILDNILEIKFRPIMCYITETILKSPYNDKNSLQRYLMKNFVKLLLYNLIENDESSKTYNIREIFEFLYNRYYSIKLSIKIVKDTDVSNKINIDNVKIPGYINKEEIPILLDFINFWCFKFFE